MCSLSSSQPLNTHTCSTTTLHLFIYPHTLIISTPHLLTLHLLTLQLLTSSSPAPPAPLDPLTEANQIGGPLTYTLILPLVPSVNGPIR